MMLPPDTALTVRWLTAFLDLPAAAHDAACAFWSAVSGTHLSDSRGDRGEFATLLPASGDAHMRTQRVMAGPGGVHVDLHVDDPAALAAIAQRLGATVLARPGHIVLTSPAGLAFCAVGWEGESQVAPPVVVGEAYSTVDQVSVDVPADRFEMEVAFWSSLTGWEFAPGSRPEFVALRRPDGIALRMLLQRLGTSDGGPASRIHLDLACGDRIAEVRDAHVALGAAVVREDLPWTVMVDPTGRPYCLTPRDPVAGVLLR